MRLRICAVGRLGRAEEAALTSAYLDRLNKLASTTRLGPAELREIDGKAGGGVPAEAAALLKAADGCERLVALDERGEGMDSAAFARRLGAWRDGGSKGVAFLIGGAAGHADLIRERCDWTVSFGRLTWPHALARAMLAEQLYRASTILAGHPYHKGD